MTFPRYDIEDVYLRRRSVSVTGTDSVCQQIDLENEALESLVKAGICCELIGTICGSLVLGNFGQIGEEVKIAVILQPLANFEPVRFEWSFSRS